MKKILFQGDSITDAGRTDGVHPIGEGCALIAKNLLNVLRKYL